MKGPWPESVSCSPREFGPCRWLIVAAVDGWMAGLSWRCLLPAGRHHMCKVTQPEPQLSTFAGARRNGSTDPI